MEVTFKEFRIVSNFSYHFNNLISKFKIMLNQNIKSNNLSDFQSTINVIQFEYQHYFDTMIEHFINSSYSTSVF